MQFFIRTLGCKVNQLDSARVAANLKNAGHIQAVSEAEADLVLVNSCTVTSQADRKGRQSIKRASSEEQQVAVFGCGPKVNQSNWSFPSVGTFTSEQSLYDYLGIEAVDALTPVNNRTRAIIEVQTGCNEQCTFCVTRIARGKHQEFSYEKILQQVVQEEQGGTKEIVLTGINLAAASLTEIIKTILLNSGIPRIRLSSLNPQYLDDEFFELFAEPRICDHLHVSVQSGSASVLKRMQRGHGVTEVEQVAAKARAVRADVAIAADMIVGFPGETDKEFGESLKFAQQIELANLHIFPYSVRPGTVAATMPEQIDGKIKKQRVAEFRGLASQLRSNFLKSQYGKDKLVLQEKNRSGLTTNYIRVECDNKVNEIFKVNITPDTVQLI